VQESPLKTTWYELFKNWHFETQGKLNFSINKNLLGFVAKKIGSSFKKSFQTQHKQFKKNTDNHPTFIRVGFG
jgi:hypothetical protein